MPENQVLKSAWWAPILSGTYNECRGSRKVVSALRHSWPTPAGITTTSPALTFSVLPLLPPSRSVAEPRAIPTLINHRMVVDEIVDAISPSLSPRVRVKNNFKDRSRIVLCDRIESTDRPTKSHL